MSVWLAANMSEDMIVDFQAYGLGVEDISKVDQDNVKALGKQITENFKKYGFCYLKHHGVDEKLLNGFMRVSRDFFKQPLDVKAKYPLGENYMYGYVKLEKETLNLERSVGDLHEAFNYVPSYDWAWPPVDQFETITKQVYEKATTLAYRFCDVLSLGLDLPIDFMRNAHAGKLFQTRTIYYPVVENADGHLAPDEARMGEHTDWGTFTFHFQNQTGGLEVQAPDGIFRAADPIPDTCVVTPSVLLQRWTSDRVKASVHRELIPKDKRREEVGQAVIFFVQPGFDYEIKCLDGSEKYPPITVKDYFASRAKDSMKRD